VAHHGFRDSVGRYLRAGKHPTQGLASTFRTAIGLVTLSRGEAIVRFAATVVPVQRTALAHSLSKGRSRNATRGSVIGAIDRHPGLAKRLRCSGVSRRGLDFLLERLARGGALLHIAIVPNPFVPNPKARRRLQALSRAKTFRAAIPAYRR
jgi:hypothetical protein